MKASPEASAADLPGSRRRFPTSLRFRLTALMAAMLLLACAVVGVASTVALHSYLTGRLDQQLALAGSRYATALEHSDHDADNTGNAETATIGQAAGTLGARLLGGSVTAIGVISATNQPVTVSDADRAVIAGLRPSAGTQQVDLPGLGRFRVLVTNGQDGDVLVTGLPTHPIEETVHHTIVAETGVFVLVVGLMILLATFAVRRSLRPLQEVSATALRVSQLPLATGDGRVAERAPASGQAGEVAQVATAVNHLLSRVEDALVERQRSEERLRRFVADASHELRTPLAVVRSHSELIQRVNEELPAQVSTSLRRIDAEARRMSRLVEDLLLLARLDAGQPLEHQPVDLSLLALDAIADARVAGPDRLWQLELSEHAVVVTGDQHRLHQVVANLLANAGLHTPPGTTVTLSVVVAADGSVLVAVQDDGPGIPAELLPSVTNRFVRGDDARSRSAGSTGLGLAIATGIARAHGGTLELESMPGRTTVTLRLPPGSQLPGTAAVADVGHA
jgi:two-component system OmpR family sensor kinase